MMRRGVGLRPVALSLGSNLGDSQATLSAAAQGIGALHEGSKSPLRSSLYRTEPWGRPDQPAFLNAAVVIESAAAASEILRAVLEIEQRHGRVRHERWGPRTLDIDVLLCGDEVVNDPDLVVPHPLMDKRAFVLIPLAEIAPSLIHPVLGKTVAALAESCGDRSSITRVGSL